MKVFKRSLSLLLALALIMAYMPSMTARAVSEADSDTYIWDNGSCVICGTACEHDAPGGYCVICGMELPVHIIENDLLRNGSFEVGGNFTSYPVSENWQIAPWTFGGSPKAEDISVSVTNEWASDGEWSLLLEDYSETNAVSINFLVDVKPGTEKEIYLSADFFTEAAKASWGTLSVIPLVNGVQPKDENGAILTAYKTRATGNFKNYAGENLGVEMTSASDSIIPADVDQLQVKVSTTRGGNSATGEDTTRVFVDNLVLTVDGVNALANASFEILPVGSAPVTVPGGDPVIAYPTSKSGVDGWQWRTSDKMPADCVEEIKWEDDTQTNAVLYMNDNSTSGTFQSNYYLYGLEKNTTYTLKFDAKKAGDANPQVIVVQLGSDGKVIGGADGDGRLDDKKTNRVTSDVMDDYTITFTTDASDFLRVRIMFTGANASTCKLWVDNISLTKDCAHNWGEALVTNEDCIHAGQRIVTCADCGAVGVTELNPCTGEHTWVDADCYAPKHCTVPGCGVTEGFALGHDCSNDDGVCARCGDAVGHKWTDAEGNSTNGVCDRCGKVCPHTDSEEAVITEATCTDTGVKTIYCPDCGYSATEEIAALGHDFIDNICQVCGVCCTHEFGETVSITPPTYTAMGEKVGICAVCGEHFTETIPAKFYGTSVNLGNTLDMYFGFYTGLVDEGGKVVFVREFADGTTETTEAPITSFKKNNSVYDITYTGLAAKEMCDTIHISVYNSEGTLVGEHSDSIRSYILRQLREKEYEQEFRTLCVDLLNYGAAAQIEFGYNADDLANKDLTAEELAEGTQIVDAYADKQTVDGDATSYYGTSYILETQISMAMAVRADRIGADCYALVSYIDHTGTEKSNIRVEGKKNYSVYEFFLNEIVVADGRCLLTIEFYTADGTKVLTVQDSMESYTARNAETYPLAEKMLAFSDSAYKYLHRNDK